MDIEQEIHNIILDEEEKLKIVFFRVIDESINFAKENNYNCVDTYLLVYDKIEELLRHISTYYSYTSNDNVPVSQEFLEEIYNYVNPLSLDATEELRNMVLALLDISYLGHFVDEFEKFKKIIDKFDKRDIRSIYECVRIRRLVNDDK